MLRNIPIIKKLEWKFRKECIHPIINSIQNIIWDNIKKFIDSGSINNILELNDFFDSKRVAIVWNSPILNDSWFWEEIDNYDIVIRFNKWIINTDLNSENTWIKTDFWSTGSLDTITSNRVKKEINKIKKQIKVLVPYPYDKIYSMNRGLNIAILELTNTYKWVNKFYMDWDFYKKICNDVNAEASSWYSLVRYISECTPAKEVGLYWFSFSTDNRISWESYATLHNFEKEEEIIMSLVDNNDKVNFHK